MAATRIQRPRLDHALLLASAALLVVGSVLPWVRGSTRVNGYIDWTGLDDTGDGGILIAVALVLAAAVRWRGALEEIDRRSRWIPLGAAITATLIWVIAMRTALYLSWFELEVGARPQIGLLLAGLGCLTGLVGGFVASRTPADRA